MAANSDTGMIGRLLCRIGLHRRARAGFHNGVVLTWCARPDCGKVLKERIISLHTTKSKRRRLRKGRV